MRKIRNPYSEIEGYNCFGCSPNNEQGLQMEFKEEGEYIVSNWKPRQHFQGYHNVLHGGIQATLMDEIASWCVQVKQKTAGVTSNMDIRYKKPVYTDKGEIIIKASIKEQRRNLTDVKVELYNHNNKLCSTALITYFTFPEKVARERFYYSDFDSFYQE